MEPEEEPRDEIRERLIATNAPPGLIEDDFPFPFEYKLGESHVMTEEQIKYYALHHERHR